MAACAGSKPENPTAIVEPLKTAVGAAYARHDAAALAALFADGAAVVTPDGKLLEGRGAIQSALATLLPSVRGYSITSRRTEVEGGIAYDQETFQITLADEGEPEHTITGHQLVILRRQPDGAWKIVESGSWSAPPAPMDDMPGMPGMSH